MKSGLFSGPAGVIIMIAFFLPWLTVSCSGSQVATLSGYELATGTLPQSAASFFEAQRYSEERGGETLLYVVPVAAIVALLSLYLNLNHGLAASVAGKLYYMTGVAGLAAMLLKYFNWQSDLAEARREVGMIINLEYEPGWWLTLIGLFGLVIAGYLAHQETEDRSVHKQSASAR